LAEAMVAVGSAVRRGAPACNIIVLQFIEKNIVNTVRNMKYMNSELKGQFSIRNNFCDKFEKL
jgi:hypothetical protein